MSKRIPKGSRKPQTRRRIPVNVSNRGSPLQGFPSSSGPRQQGSPFNARGRNVNFAQGSSGKQVNNAMQKMTKDVMALRKENTALKAKLAQAQKKP